MTHTCRGPSYADRLWQGTVEILENAAVARDTYRIRLACPEIAQRVLPGQFLMLRIAGANDPLLARPLALYDVVQDNSGRPAAIEIVYLAVGKMTRRLAMLKPGAVLEMWGPLGNGFAAIDADQVLMVAGGIGQTPFLALGKECLGLGSFGDPRRSVRRASKVTLCYGARSAEYLACVDDFCRLGVDLRLSTDDGSTGYHGRVTDLIASAAQGGPGKCQMVACGPEAMLAVVTAAAKELGIPCQVSLETPMACGIGICFSCVAKIRDVDGTWDYRRTCVEGPIFDSTEVEF